MNDQSRPPQLSADMEPIFGQAPLARGDLRGPLIPATLGFWCAAYFILSLRAFLDGAEPFFKLAALRFGLAIAGVFLCYIIHILLSRLGGRKFRLQLIAAVILAPVAAEAFTWLNELSLRAIGIEAKGPISAGAVIMNMSFWLWFFLAWSTMYLAISYNIRLVKEQSLWEEARALAQAARLDALRFQINPHFLFNTLNAISLLVAEHRNEEAETMINRMASFFRTSLTSDLTDRIPLAQELTLQRIYLDIERVRYPDLEIVEDVSSECLDCQVPALILQPIVENAIKFGIGSRSSEAVIGISALCAGGILTLCVRDKGTSAVTCAGTGTGLRNVRERLRALYGEKAQLIAGPRAAGGFEVMLKMPEMRK